MQPYCDHGRLNIVKMSVLSKLIHRFNTIPIKILGSIFWQIEKIIVNFIWKGKKQEQLKTIFKKKNKFQGISLLDFKIYYIIIVIKTIWKLAWEQTHKSIEQNIEPEMNPYKYVQFIKAKKLKHRLFNKCGSVGHQQAKNALKLRSHSLLKIYLKINHILEYKI